MEARGKTPRGSQNKNHWHTDKMKPGDSFQAWLAGPGVCVTMHDAMPTKPCLKRYMGFDIPCPGCASRLKLVDLIFTPVYRDILLKKVVVPLRAAAYLLVSPMMLHTCVTVGRPTARNEGRYIETRPKTIPFPLSPENEFPVCIAEWLPVMWGYTGRISGEHLLRGPVFDATEAQRPSAVEAAKRKADDEAKMAAITEEQRRNRLRGKTDLETLHNVGNDLFKVNPATESNGKH